ncbi:MAG TPA: hypothetical protein VLZ54_06360 [Arenibacter sp.]|nr:hypothetical protein [Arenibacter sp.]
MTKIRHSRYFATNFLEFYSFLWVLFFYGILQVSDKAVHMPYTNAEARSRHPPPRFYSFPMGIPAGCEVNKI